MSEVELNLCGNCWCISHPNGWWAYNIVDGVPEDTDGDPSFYRCHQCGFDHRDDDADPGVWSASREELERIRLDEQPELRPIREALSALGDAVTELDPSEDLPKYVRDELLRRACSMNDYVFHVYKRRQRADLSDNPDTWMYWAHEVESDSGSWGVTAREALESYFRDDILDHIVASPSSSPGETE